MNVGTIISIPHLHCIVAVSLDSIVTCSSNFSNKICVMHINVVGSGARNLRLSLETICDLLETMLMLNSTSSILLRTYVNYLFRCFRSCPNYLL